MGLDLELEMLWPCLSDWSWSMLLSPVGKCCQGLEQRGQSQHSVYLSGRSGWGSFLHPVGVNTEMLFPQVLSLAMGNLGYECESAEQCVGISPGQWSPAFCTWLYSWKCVTGMLQVGWGFCLVLTFPETKNVSWRCHKVWHQSNASKLLSFPLQMSSGSWLM